MLFTLSSVMTKVVTLADGVDGGTDTAAFSETVASLAPGRALRRNVGVSVAAAVSVG